MSTGSVLILLILFFFSGYLWLIRYYKTPVCHYGRREPSRETGGNTFPRHPPKPEWVKEEVIRLKALMPRDGYRKIAYAFNRLHAHKRKMTVGKTYVGYIIRNHQYEIQVLRREMKHKLPRSIPQHLIWGLDLTYKTDHAGQQHPILGIVEHRSRACVTLSAITDKSAITLLRLLCRLIETYPKPQLIRTDNEAVLTSRLFRFGLWLLRIKHQRTEIACPWQNGRIERFFGTLKDRLNQWEIVSLESLNQSLPLFRFWYNHVRPHQHLGGLTPAEVWREKTDLNRERHQVYWFDAWDGLLRGYYLLP